jgi:hypothetical protein
MLALLQLLSEASKSLEKRKQINSQKKRGRVKTKLGETCQQTDYLFSKVQLL